MPAQLSQRIVKKAPLSPSLGKLPPTQGTSANPRSPQRFGNFDPKVRVPETERKASSSSSFSPSRVLIPIPRSFYRSQRFSQRVHTLTLFIGQREAETSSGNATKLQPATARPSTPQPYFIHRISPITQVPSAIPNIPHDADNEDSDIIPPRWPGS